MNLIDKDALVAEIERLVSNGKIKCQQSQENNDQESYVAWSEHIATCEKILSFLDTLEVKEDNLLTEKVIERELAEAYINVFDKKFGNKLPKLKGTQLHDFKNFINTCEQTFCMKYFDYHATQGKLFEKLALLWAVWGKEHLSTEVKEVDLEKEIQAFAKIKLEPIKIYDANVGITITMHQLYQCAKHFFELGLKAQKGE